MGQQERLLCKYSGGRVSGDNGHEAQMHEQSAEQKSAVVYQISSRSRCTQLCIFLILESKQGNILSSGVGHRTDNDAQTTARIITSTILFKWQTTESHYRALASAIAQNKKPAS